MHVSFSRSALEGKENKDTLFLWLVGSWMLLSLTLSSHLFVECERGSSHSSKDNGKKTDSNYVWIDPVRCLLVYLAGCNASSRLTSEVKVWCVTANRRYSICVL